jgi:hypothetical protein
MSNWILNGGAASRLGGATLVVALCLLVLSPGASGAQPQKVTTMTPPYSGWKILQNVHNADLCGKGSATSKITKPTYFNFTTGIGGMGGSGSAKSCRNGQTSTGYTDQYLQIFLPIASHSGHPTIYINGSYVLSGNLSFTAGRCIPTPGSNYGWCDQVASIQAGIRADFVDLSSPGQREFYVGAFTLYNSSYRSESCNLGNCTNYTSGPNGTLGSFSDTGSFSFAYKVTKRMNSTQSYALELGVYGEVDGACDVQFFRDLGCSTSAIMNFGTMGNGFGVSSIVVK